MQNIKIIMKVIEFTKRISEAKILSSTIQFFPKSHLFIVGGLSALLLTTAVTSYSAKEPVRSSQPLNLQLAAPSAGPIEDTATETVEPSIIWHTQTVKSGDSLSVLFDRVGLSNTVMNNFLNSSKSAKKLLKIYPGQKISFHTDNGQLKGIRYQKNKLHRVEFTHTEKGFIDDSIVITPDTHTAYREAIIINSLFLAGTDAGLEESLIMELANIFGWDIDFALDIRANDSFKVLYEEQFIDGEKIGNGPILAAEFTNQKKTYKAVRYTDKKGDTNYYTPEGKSMRKAFLRTPVDFARISSHFNLKRKHPILNKIRAHKGTDYAAPTGTPIKAAGNGKVEFAGVKGGYGRTVVIRHGQSYKTLYAHMHKYGKGVRTGSRVKQGQIIGYVGKSGLATGPHLHYEFYKNGVVRNPVRVELPKAKSIPKSLLNDFELQTRPLVAQLKEFTKKTQLAASTSSLSKN
jgi:murein DD-endopeptidase MepM/ murein hydrolase activator NlpD